MKFSIVLPVLLSLFVYYVQSIPVAQGTYKSLAIIKRAQRHPVVGFTAVVDQDISIINHQTAIFDTVITNTGNGYDRSSGRFTAPVKGLYWFGITAMAAPYKTVSVELTKNGVSVARCNGSRYGSNSVVLNLDVGDVVLVRHFKEGTIGPETMFGHHWSTFSGLLIDQE